VDIVLKLYINVEAEHLLPLLDLKKLSEDARAGILTKFSLLESDVRQAVRDYVFDHAEAEGSLDYEGVEDADVTDLSRQIFDEIRELALVAAEAETESGQEQ
jgi:hypothetical protein